MVSADEYDELSDEEVSAEEQKREFIRRLERVVGSKTLGRQRRFNQRVTQPVQRNWRSSPARVDWKPAYQQSYKDLEKSRTQVKNWLSARRKRLLNPMFDKIQQARARKLLASDREITKGKEELLDFYDGDFYAFALESFQQSQIPPPPGASNWTRKLVKDFDESGSAEYSEPSGGESPVRARRNVPIESDDESSTDGEDDYDERYDELERLRRQYMTSYEDVGIVRAGSETYEVPGDLIDPRTGEVISYPTSEDRRRAFEDMYDPSLTYEQRLNARRTLRGPRFLEDDGTLRRGGSFQHNEGYERRRLERERRRQAQQESLPPPQSPEPEQPYVDRTQRRFWTQGESYADWITNQKKKWREQRFKRKGRAIVQAGSKIPGDLVDPRTGEVTTYARDTPPTAGSDDTQDAYVAAYVAKEIARDVASENSGAKIAELERLIRSRLNELGVPKPQGRRGKGWSKAAVMQLMKDAGLRQSRPRRAPLSDATVVDSSSDDGGESPLPPPIGAGALEMLGDDSIEQDTWLRVAREIVDFYNGGVTGVHHWPPKTSRDFISQKLPEFYSQIERLDPGKQDLAVKRLARYYHRRGIQNHMNDH